MLVSFDISQHLQTLASSFLTLDEKGLCIKKNTLQRKVCGINSTARNEHIFNITKLEQ